MPLRIDEILTKLRDALQDWGAPLKAQVSIARDPFHVLEILGSGTGHRLVAHWAGDTNVSTAYQVPMLEHSLEVVFSYNLGLGVNPDGALITAQGDRPPLYQLLDDVRALVTALAFPGPGEIEYAGTEPVVTPEGIPLAAFRLKFKLISSPVLQPRPVPV